MSKKALFETVKFVARMSILILVPILLAEVTKLKGTWYTLTDNVLPIALPIIDKWVHEDPRFKTKGIIPF